MVLQPMVTNNDSGFSSLRELCHDLMEPAATIRLLARAADTESAAKPQLRNCLRLMAAEARQITVICEHVLHQSERDAAVRLDVLAEDAVAIARERYRGMIDVVARPVMVLAHPGVVIRILSNLLTNACRAAGPDGRVRVLVDEADSQARLAVADSGHGLGQVAAGRARLGLEIIGTLALGSGGTVHMGVSDLGGLAVSVGLPCPQVQERRYAE